MINSQFKYEITDFLCIISMIFILFFGRINAHASVLSAGSAKIDISPDTKVYSVPLGGYAARKGKPATGVHDPVFARAVVLSEGHEKVAIVSTDLCFLPVCIRNTVVQKIVERGIKDIPPDHLFLCATHTHTAPDPLAMHTGNRFRMPGWSVFDAKLLEFTASKIADSIVQARSSLQEANVSSGSMELSNMNHNRRGGPLTDRTLTLVNILGKNRLPIAVIVNFAAHPTLYDDKMMDFSADWPGKMCSEIDQKYGKGCVALFLNGAEGDASPSGTVGTTSEEKIADYGSRMAGFVTDLSSKSKPNVVTKIQAWQTIIELPARRPNGLFLAAASQFGATISQAKEFVTELMPQKSTLSFAKIGSVLLIGFPCEPTAAIGIEAKIIAHKFGIDTPAVVALANDWLGYVLTTKEYQEGNYEAGMSFFGDQLGPKLLFTLNESLSTKYHNQVKKPPLTH